MLTQASLQQLFDYDPESGVVTNRVWRNTRSKAGARAGGPSGRGYRTIGIDGKRYFEHIVIWIYVTGEQPLVDIDHEDGDGSNNRWSNLRLLTHKQNLENRKTKQTESGCIGVTRCRNKWRAQIKHNYKGITLGIYDDLADAIHVRRAAERLLFTHSKSCLARS